MSMTKEEYMASVKTFEGMAIEFYKDVAKLDPVARWAIANRFLAFVAQKDPRADYQALIAASMMLLATAKPNLPKELESL